MIRAFVLLLFMAGSVMAQGISFGIHGCGAWSKLKGSTELLSIESNDYTNFYGIGGDIALKPARSPIGVEAGFTYLVRNEKHDGMDFGFKTHPLYVNGKLYLNPMFYVGGGVNYTFWDFDINDIQIEDLNSRLGYQFGGGVETGAAGISLYGNAYYMIQKGKIEPDSEESGNLQIRSC